jgi:hypothetical protein
MLDGIYQSRRSITLGIFRIRWRRPKIFCQDRLRESNLQLWTFKKAEQYTRQQSQPGDLARHAKFAFPPLLRITGSFELQSEFIIRPDINTSLRLAYHLIFLFLWFSSADGSAVRGRYLNIRGDLLLHKYVRVYNYRSLVPRRPRVGNINKIIIDYCDDGKGESGFLEIWWPSVL